MKNRICKVLLSRKKKKLNYQEQKFKLCKREDEKILNFYYQKREYKS